MWKMSAVMGAQEQASEWASMEEMEVIWEQEIGNLSLVPGDSFPVLFSVFCSL